jgi:3-hydroxyisobutyrate dehydrogenase-like beta-hydroxyacid dehydrogenase
VSEGLQVMARSISDVRVLGLGKIGELVATLLMDSGFAVTGYDFRERGDVPFPTRMLDVRDTAALTAALLGGDAVVSCVPNPPHFARRGGRACRRGALLRPD